MIWNFVVQIAIAVALTFLSYVLAPKPKVPRLAGAGGEREFDDPTSDVGRAIPVVFGTVTVTAPNVIFTGEKHKRQLNRQRTRYYRNIHYGICQGPIDAIRRVRLNEKACLGDDFTVPPSGRIHLPEFNGGTSRGGGVSGWYYWQNGSYTQVMPNGMAEAYGEASDQLPGYRGIATFMFRHADAEWVEAEREGFSWGLEPFIPPVDFMVTRIPVGWYEARAAIQPPAGITTSLVDEVTGVSTTLGPNCNPAHIIRECLVNEIWGAGISETMLNDTSFRAAADIFYAEGLGLSFQFDTSSREVEELIEQVRDHAEAVLYESPLTGQLYLRPLRGGYDLTTLTTYDESNSRVQSIARKLFTEIPNEVALTWTSPATEKPELVTLQNLAAVARSGSVITDNRGMPGIRDVETAWKIAERELASTTEQALAGEIDLDRTARGMVPGDVFRVTSEDHRLDEVVVRALRVDYGRPGAERIRVNFMEDVFARNAPDFERAGQGAVPGTPRDFNLTAEDTAAMLRWEEPTDPGGTPILRYEYQMDAGQWRAIPGGAATRGYRVDGLTNDTLYTFRLRAVNSIGPGSPTVPLSIGPSGVVARVPGVPQNFGAIAIGQEIEIFAEPPISDGGATIFRYEYEIDGEDLYLTNAGYNPMTPLAGDPPTIINPRPGPPPAPPAPSGNTGPTSPLPGDGDAYAFWRAALWNPRAGRTLRWSNATGNFAADDGPREAIVEGALNLDALVATRSAFAAWSRWLNVTFEEVDDAADNHIRVGYVQSPSPGIIGRAWPRPAGSRMAITYNPGLIETYYDRTPKHEVGHIIGLLHPDQQSAGGGDLSETIMETLGHSVEDPSSLRLGDIIGGMHLWGRANDAPYVAPDYPTNWAAAPGSGMITLSWALPVIDGGSVVTGYKLYRRDAGGEEQIEELGAGTLMYEDTDVTPGSTYAYRVQAVNLIGDGLWSREIDAAPA